MGTSQGKRALSGGLDYSQEQMSTYGYKISPM